MVDSRGKRSFNIIFCLVLGCKPGADDDIGIGFDDMIISEVLNQLASDVRVAFVDVDFVLVLLASRWFIDKIAHWLLDGNSLWHPN